MTSWTPYEALTLVAPIRDCYHAQAARDHEAESR